MHIFTKHRIILKVLWSDLVFGHAKLCRRGLQGGQWLRSGQPWRWSIVLRDMIEWHRGYFTGAHYCSWGDLESRVTNCDWLLLYYAMGEHVSEENFSTLWCKVRLREADTPTIRLGATPSGLASAHLHQPNPPAHFLQARCPSCRPTYSIKALKAPSANNLCCAITTRQKENLWTMIVWCGNSLRTCFTNSTKCSE